MKVDLVFVFVVVLISLGMPSSTEARAERAQAWRRVRANSPDKNPLRQVLEKLDRKGKLLQETSPQNIIPEITCDKLHEDKKVLLSQIAEMSCDDIKPPIDVSSSSDSTYVPVLYDSSSTEKEGGLDPAIPIILN